ncbi:4Fe-4S binding protein, partial [bacterium]|nr:4Fe-4S binding protein [bacterium]
MKTIAKLRVPFMVLIYVLFFGHVALWYLGKVNSVGHLGFGNFFLTLQTGLVSAGTVFSIIVFLLSLVLGGVFCGWACHWGIIQDFSYWVFERIGIKPKMIRIESTIIPWIWFTVILGQLVFAWIAFGLPKGFSMELGNPEVWSGVPRSIFLICITMVTNSFFLIFLLGKRAFCRTICSFRLWFNWFNHIAPLKMVRKKECKHCGNCRNECLMGIDVVGEMDSFGHVKNKSCLRCMNCSLVCPNSAPQAAFWSINPEVNPEKEFQPLPLHIDSDSSLLISAVSAITLVFFCAFWGGSISMSAGFCFGVIIWRALSQKNISSFEALAIPLLLVSLLYRVDLNDFTSLIKGVFLILIF